MTEHLLTEINSCRICNHETLRPVLDLGEVPPANNFVEDRTRTVEQFPLVVVYCESCTHVQLKYTLDRSYLFDKYPYLASESGTIPEHFEKYSALLEGEFLSEGDLIVDVGSNDGGLLRGFSDGIDVLGVEPADNVATVAKRSGIPTVVRYFTPETARTIRNEYGEAQVITANNVLAHVDDLRDFLRAIDALLAAQGVVSIEVPYLVDLVSKVEFDTIYHEHISYFSVRSLRELAQIFDLEIYDVERLDRHGGSIRVFVQRRSGNRPVSSRVEELRMLEDAMGLGEHGTYRTFERAVERKQEQIRSLVKSVSARGGQVVGYGASAKGNVLLNTCDLSSDSLSYLVDEMTSKQGKFAPGTGLPVRSPEKFRDDAPEWTILLAWNYADSILEQETEYRNSGGRFILPAPNLAIR